MSTSRAKSRAAIGAVARALGPERDRIVFVGGTVTALYSLPEGLEVRPTIDVDCVVDVATTVEYYAFVGRLRALGFSECMDEGAPMCRLVHSGIRVDLVATVDTGVGPTNRWYKEAMHAAERFDVDDGVPVLAITPFYFVATKLEAFRGRGNNDYLASHDLEDVLTVLAASATLRSQISSGAGPATEAVRSELVALASRTAFIDAVPGHFQPDERGQAHADVLLAWVKALRGPP